MTRVAVRCARIQRTTFRTLAARLPERVSDLFDHTRGNANTISTTERLLFESFGHPLAVHIVPTGPARVLVMLEALRTEEHQSAVIG